MTSYDAIIIGTGQAGAGANERPAALNVLSCPCSQRALVRSLKMPENPTNLNVPLDEVFNEAPQATDVSDGRARTPLGMSARDKAVHDPSCSRAGAIHSQLSRTAPPRRLRSRQPVTMPPVGVLRMT